jgi:hypothetical protein
MATMGLLANLRFARQRARKRPTRSCSHLGQIRDVTPSSTGCQPCLERGDTQDSATPVLTRGLPGLEQRAGSQRISA